MLYSENNTQNIIHTLIFLHVTKTGGTTLRRILDKKFRSMEIVTLHKSDVFPDGNDMRVNDFIKLSIENKQTVRFIRGHIDFGLHRHIPHPSTYITLLRDPVERIISWYYFLLQNKNPESKDYTEGILKSKDIKDFIYKGKGGRNTLTRQFCSSSEWRKAKSPAERYGIAETNLEKYFLFGILEKFDESLILFKRFFGWQDLPVYTKANVTKKRPKRHELPLGAIDVINESFNLDIKLYNRAKKLINQKLKVTNGNFSEELAKLKLMKNLAVKAEKHALEYEFDKAIEDYKIVVDFAPNSCDVQNYMGFLYASSQDLDRALVHFRNAFVLNPGDPAVIHNVGKTLHKLGFEKESEHFMAMLV